MQLEVAAESWAYATPFRITNFVFTAADVLVFTLRDGPHMGRGEASGVYYHGETPASMTAQIDAVRGAIEAGADRAARRRALPRGGARNGLDAALWDLEAKRRGEPAWRIAGEAAPRALRTTFTVSAGPPEAVAEAARGFPDARAIKLKLTEDDPAGCVRAVRAA